MATAGPGGGAGTPLAKPPVRKLARDLGIDLATLIGSGPHGSITRSDVEAAAAAATAVAAAPEYRSDRTRRFPVRGVHRLMAENMATSASTAPQATVFLTIDATNSVLARQRLREHPDWQGVRVSPLLLVAKAALVAIRRHPLVNSSWADTTGEIIVKEYVNLGVATATARGLIVPNIQDAGQLTLRELAEALAALTTAAREGQTTAADMAEGTFTITNVGVFGVDAGTPILPPGQAAILALGAIKERPWVVDGEVRPRHVTTLATTFDHRVLDGESAALFLRDVGAFLADPGTSLLAWT